MPRSANTLSALKSEPGSFGSENTIVVLSATRLGSGAPADDEEARDVVVEVLDRRRERHEAEHLARARRGDRRRRRVSPASATIFALPAVS